MSYAMSGFNPMAASSLPQLLGVAQSIVPGLFNGSAGAYGMSPGYEYGAMPGTVYGMPPGYGAMPASYMVTQQTSYQQTYYGMSGGSPYGMGCPSGMCGPMIMHTQVMQTQTLPYPQAGWGGSYYPAYY
ncbi:hypothetical protein [Vampirovibrio chlorellavorus]|uniref:hypothetical protein n=1 Tax=Vampirovibrio chlorellavorus TaxID=758823 RepID=UPI0026EBB106|nr:hypothetical protein [Vampirovibrio chlorellavorus]